MNPPPPRFLLLLLFTAATLVLTVPLKPALSARYCPPCGTREVPYPLSTDPTCGDPLYSIQCDSGVLGFPATNDTYPILSIDPQNQRLVFKPAPNVANTCVASDLAQRGPILSRSLPFNFTEANLVMLFNCTDAMLMTPLNCTADSPCRAYAREALAGSPCDDGSMCCSFRPGGPAAYGAAIGADGCSSYMSVVLSEDGGGDWPEPGMEIQWAPPPEPPCGSQSDCDSSSTCRVGGSGSGGASRCYCNSALSWDPVRGICAESAEDRARRRERRTELLIGLGCGLVALGLAASAGIQFYRKRKCTREAREDLSIRRQELLNAGANKAKLFTGKELKKATDNFSRDRLLGSGGYGEVYKGILGDGTCIAVKCAKLGNAKGVDQVLNEVRILCQVNHKNLVRLLGCCVDLEHPVMVYEYISNGTLSDHLQNPNSATGTKYSRLSWIDRLRIAHDTAEALAYLHFSAVPPIYHRDVKSSNILLDENLNAKVSDFGLSRLAESDLTHISTCAQGTIGYLDPEYYKKYQLTDKSDVYSFGVVLLELVTSQRAIDFNRTDDDVNLAVYVERMVEEGKFLDAIDPLLIERASSDTDLETMKALAFLGLNCLDEKRENRPSMKEVTEEIEYIISIAAFKEEQK